MSLLHIHIVCTLLGESKVQGEQVWPSAFFGHASSFGVTSSRDELILLPLQHRKYGRRTHLKLLQKLIVALVAHRRDLTSHCVAGSGRCRKIQPVCSLSLLFFVSRSSE